MKTKIAKLLTLVVAIFCITSLFACDSKVTVTFSANGGAFEGGETEIKLELDKDSLITEHKEPTRAGYTLLGFSKNEYGEPLWNFETDKVTKSIKLFAIWSKNSTDISPDDNETSGKNYSKGLEFTLSEDGTYYSVTGIGTCEDANLLIPPKYENLPVKNIGDYAFYFCIGVESVEIPKSIVSVGEGAFLHCWGLESIEISETVTSIGASAFSYCAKLANVEIPASITSIGEYAFSSQIVESLIVAPENASYHINGNCLIETKTKTLIAGCKNSVIPTDGSVTSIGDYAFADCTELANIEIPASVTSIGISAFSNQTIESLTIASGNTSYHINDNCLIETKTKTLISGCKNSVIPTDGSVTSIGDYAFADCTELANIEIPASVTSIGDDAFYGCTELKSIEIPTSVTNIGAGAFVGCTDIESLTVASGNSVYHSANNCIIETKSKTLITGSNNIIIPADGSVTAIGEWAFDWAVLDEIIDIPASVTSIGTGAFYCTHLETINYSGTKAEWAAIKKAENWIIVTEEYVVICTDGTISENGG